MNNFYGNFLLLDIPRPCVCGSEYKQIMRKRAAGPDIGASGTLVYTRQCSTIITIKLSRCPRFL